MLLYAHTLTPRLRYITHWFTEQFLFDSIECTDSIEQYRAHTGLCINYSKERIRDTECWIQAATLLFESDIHPIRLDVQQNGTFSTFFCGRGDMGFDVFAASFYLISRYEEYLPHPSDAYGRFSHDASLAFQHGFLDRPIVDQWMQQFCLCLQSKFPELVIRPIEFSHLATYDIDESFAYQHKPVWLQAAGLLRDIILFRLAWVRERVAVWLNQRPDPYDSFEFIRSLHVNTSTRPLIFILMAEQRGQYDKNLSPQHPAQAQLIRSLSSWSDLALHPSWRSGDEPELLIKEKQHLQALIGRPIRASRQHYIRFRLPTTYRLLVEAGLQADYSMGYGSINGFRAGTARSFFWYDLAREQVSTLCIYPFCYMEANSFYELGQGIEEAANDWTALEGQIRQYGGTMITVWHNTFLGTRARFSGWRERYANWFRGLCN